MDKFEFNVLAVVGVGLLGGSVALGLRERACVGQIIGFGRREQSLATARELGVIDRYTLDLDDAVRDADLVVVAAPARAACDIIRRMGPMVKPDAVVTDVVSTKTDVVESAAESWPVPVRFVGSHPIAGSHLKGASYSRPDLFEGAVTVVTPDRTTDVAALETVTAIWQRLGSRVINLTPTDHDSALAITSHLPHMVACAMALAVGESEIDPIPLAGRGLADTTRVAAGDPEMWRDICLTNRTELIRALGVYDRIMSRLRLSIETCDEIALEKMFQLARDMRCKIGETADGD